MYFDLMKHKLFYFRNHKIESLVNITKDYNESGSSSKKVKSGEIKKIKNSSKDITSPTPSTSKVSTCTP